MANWKFDVRGISLELKPGHVLWKTSPVTKSVSRSCVSCVANGCSHWQFYHHLLHLDSFPCHNSCPQHSAILHLTYALLLYYIIIILLFYCSFYVPLVFLLRIWYLVCSLHVPPGSSTLNESRRWLSVTREWEVILLMTRWEVAAHLSCAGQRPSHTSQGGDQMLDEQFDHLRLN